MTPVITFSELIGVIAWATIALWILVGLAVQYIRAKRRHKGENQK
jgi:hypothetical protein